jgi:hypothetical protein
MGTSVSPWQKAAEGDRAAQYSQGCRLLSGADAARRSPDAEAGLALTIPRLSPCHLTISCKIKWRM